MAKLPLLQESTKLGEQLDELAESKSQVDQGALKQDLIIADLVTKAFRPPCGIARDLGTYVSIDSDMAEYIATTIKLWKNRLFLQVPGDDQAVQQLTQAGFQGTAAREVGDNIPNGKDFIINFNNNDEYQRFVQLLIKRIASDRITNAAEEVKNLYVKKSKEVEQDLAQLNETARGLEVPVNAVLEMAERESKQAFASAISGQAK